jgi:hypothetical protein
MKNCDSHLIAPFRHQFSKSHVRKDWLLYNAEVDASELNLPGIILPSSCQVLIRDGGGNSDDDSAFPLIYIVHCESKKGPLYFCP